MHNMIYIKQFIKLVMSILTYKGVT